jgi:molybdopterin biosynthesis enzyme
VRVVAEGGELLAYPLEPQGSGMLSSLAGANGLLTLSEEITVAEAGDNLPVLMLDWEA